MMNSRHKSTLNALWSKHRASILSETRGRVNENCLNNSSKKQVKKCGNGRQTQASPTAVESSSADMKWWEDESFGKVNQLNSQLQSYFIIMSLFRRKKRYSQISYEKRIKLIELVEEQQLFVYQAAKRLRIKLPTAKVILQNYRKNGKIFQKRVEGKLQPAQMPQSKRESSEVLEEEEQKLEIGNAVTAENPWQFVVVYPLPAIFMF